MVVVVPGLSERHQRQPGDVRRLVLDVEAPAPEDVADRVDRPRHVVDEEDPHEAGPQQRPQRRGQREAVQDEARDERDQQAQADERQVVAADPAHHLVLAEIGGVLAKLGRALRLGEPAAVRVPEAPQAGTLADVWAVRVALLVGVGVVQAMVCDPGDRRSLDRHRSCDRKGVLDRLARLKRAVGEQAVIADRDAEAGDEVHDEEDRQVDRADGLVPQQDDRKQERDEGNDDGAEIGVLEKRGHAIEGTD